MDVPGSSTRPYLLRALHDWCSDNGFTPFIAVHVDASVQVPKDYVRNQEIVLNVGFEATSGLKMGNEWVEFTARFGGVPQEIRVPVTHVVAIYARENGQGMAFPMPSAEPTTAAVQGPEAHAPAGPASTDRPRPRPVLRTAPKPRSDDAPPPDSAPVGQAEAPAQAVGPSEPAARGGGLRLASQQASSVKTAELPSATPRHGRRRSDAPPNTGTGTPQVPSRGRGPPKTPTLASDAAPSPDTPTRRSTACTQAHQVAT
jgi:stringent starvation protein B